MYLRKSSNRRQDASIDEPLNTDTDGNELLLMDVLTSDDPRWARNWNAMPNVRPCAAQCSGFPRERRIMELRFGLNHEEEHTQRSRRHVGHIQSYISRLESASSADYAGAGGGGLKSAAS